MNKLHSSTSRRLYCSLPSSCGNSNLVATAVCPPSKIHYTPLSFLQLYPLASFLAASRPSCRLPAAEACASLTSQGVQSPRPTPSTPCSAVQAMQVPTTIIRHDHAHRFQKSNSPRNASRLIPDPTLSLRSLLFMPVKALRRVSYRFELSFC